MQQDIAAPMTDSTGMNAPAARAVAVDSSITPMAAVAPRTPSIAWSQLSSGLLAMKGAMPPAS